MSDIAKRYLTGTGFVVLAILLVHLGEAAWAIMPAATAVYILGWLLLDVWKDQV